MNFSDQRSGDQAFCSGLQHFLKSFRVLGIQIFQFMGVATVLHAYPLHPLQGLWLFPSVVHSRKLERESRGKEIINQVKLNDPTRLKSIA
jgi:hypothetical protein